MRLEKAIFFMVEVTGDTTVASTINETAFSGHIARLPGRRDQNDNFKKVVILF